MRIRIYWLLFVAVGLWACENPQGPGNATLDLNPVTLQMKVGDMATIDATGTATNIEWKSSNEEVATV